MGRHGQITLDKARELAKRKMGSVASDIDIQEEKKAVKHAALVERSSTLGGFIESLYENFLLTERRTGPDLLASLKANFGSFYDRQLVEITVGAVSQWRTDRLKKGIAPASVNRDISTLKAALNKALEWGIIDVHPLAALKPLKLDKKGRVRFLSEDEETRLRDALVVRDKEKIDERRSANDWRESRNYELLPNLPEGGYADHLTPLILLALNTGMRRGELFQLTWNNVDLDRRLITLFKAGRQRRDRPAIYP